MKIYLDIMGTINQNSSLKTGIYFAWQKTCLLYTSTDDNLQRVDDAIRADQQIT